MVEQMRRLLEKIQAARLAIYVLGGNGPARPAVSAENAIALMQPDWYHLDELPKLTGGRAWDDRGVQYAFEQMNEDEQAAYRIAYDPGPANWDGRYHTLTLRCLRPDVHLTTASGYIAQATSDTAEQRELSLSQLLRRRLASPLLLSDINFSVQHASLDTAKGQLSLELNIEPRDLVVNHGPDISCASLKVSMAGLAETGRWEELGTPEDLAVQIPGHVRPEPEHVAVRVTRRITPHQNYRVIRVAIVDPRSGDNGDVQVSLTEKNATADHG